MPSAWNRAQSLWTNLVADGKRKLVFSMEGEGLQFPVYSPTGHILFQRITGNPGIWALPFSLHRLEATGEAFLVAQGAIPSVSSDGTLLFVRAESTAKQLGWVNRKGEVSRLLGGSMQSPEGPAVSPDGRKVRHLHRAELVRRIQEQVANTWSTVLRKANSLALWRSRSAGVG